MSLIFKSLSKYYGTQKALDCVSFEVLPGMIMGFLGPNGAGKSTAMKIAVGYIPASYGEVEVCGLNTETHSLEVRKLVGYLPENNPLYYEMYVREYLEFCGHAHGLRSNDLKKAVLNMIEKTGLDREKHKKIGQLSKGYKQRVGLAQAMIHDPKVLILDEPTTGLDPNQVVEIRELIKEAGRDKTVIFSSHIMQEVQEICNNIVIINKGKIVANQTPDKLKELVADKVSISVTFDSLPVLDKIDTFILIEKVTSHQFRFIGENEKLIRETIFKLSADQSINVISLIKEENSLEQIFRKFTSDK